MAKKNVGDIKEISPKEIMDRLLSGQMISETSAYQIIWKGYLHNLNLEDLLVVFDYFENHYPHLLGYIINNIIFSALSRNSKNPSFIK